MRAFGKLTSSVLAFAVLFPAHASGQVPDAATVDSVMAFTLSSHAVIARDMIRDRETGDCISKVVLVRDGPNTYGDYYNWTIGWFPPGDYFDATANPGAPTAPVDIAFREPVPALADWFRDNGRLRHAASLSRIVAGLESRHAETGRTAWGWADLIRQSGNCRAVESPFTS